MNYARKADNNQNEIVSDLRQIGYRVEVLSRVGGGVPDLMVADDRHQVWVEVKRRGKKLTEAELAFFERWPTRLRIVAYSVEDVLQWFERL